MKRLLLYNYMIESNNLSRMAEIEDTWEEELEKAGWGEELNIDGEKFYLGDKDGYGGEVWEFLVDNWYKPEGIFDEYPSIEDVYINRGIRRAVNSMNRDILRNAEGDIIAVSTFNPKPKEESDHLFLVVVREDYQKRGIGTLLRKRAIDSIIAASKDSGQVEIRAEAASKTGKLVLEKLKKSYGERIRLMVTDTYKPLDKDDLPEGFEICSCDYELEEKRESVREVVGVFVEENHAPLSQEERENMKDQLTERQLELNDLDQTCFVYNPDDSVVALSAYEKRGEHEGKNGFLVLHAEITMFATLPEYQNGNIPKLMLLEQEDYIHKDDESAYIAVLTKNPQLLAYAKERNYEEIPLEQYFDRIDDERIKDAERMRSEGFHVLVKEGVIPQKYEMTV